LFKTADKSSRPVVALNEEATHHVRSADPTDPGDAADLSNSMGYLEVLSESRQHNWNALLSKNRSNPNPAVKSSNR
jgi:hypothetical protein